MGEPLAAVVNDPATPVVNEALLALLNVGDGFTVMLNDWVAGVPTPLVAVTVSVAVPVVVVMPDNRPLGERVRPDGSVPVVTLKVGAGYPVAVNWKLPFMPFGKVTALALVKAGAVRTGAVPPNA